MVVVYQLSGNADSFDVRESDDLLVVLGQIIESLKQSGETWPDTTFLSAHVIARLVANLAEDRPCINLGELSSFAVANDAHARTPEAL